MNNFFLKNIEKLMMAEDYEKARGYLIEAIEKDPHNPEAHYLLGDVFCKLGNFENSIKELETANFLLPQNPQIIHLLGWASFMNGDINRGRKLMEAALSVMPDDIHLLCDVAVLEMNDANTKALEYSEKAMKINPHDPMVKEVFMVTNKFHQARENLKKKQLN